MFCCWLCEMLPIRSVIYIQPLKCLSPSVFFILRLALLLEGKRGRGEELAVSKFLDRQSGRLSLLFSLPATPMRSLGFDEISYPHSYFTVNPLALFPTLVHFYRVWIAVLVLSASFMVHLYILRGERSCLEPSTDKFYFHYLNYMSTLSCFFFFFTQALKRENPEFDRVLWIKADYGWTYLRVILLVVTSPWRNKLIQKNRNIIKRAI